MDVARSVERYHHTDAFLIKRAHEVLV